MLCDNSDLVLPPCLNDDCWLDILCLCDEKSLLSLRLVSKYFYTAASCDSLWYGSCVQLGVTMFHHWESMIACYLRTTRLRLAEDTLMGRNDVCQSTERGLELLRRCVHRGDSRAAEIIGWAYLSDCYVPPDKTEALRWFKESQSLVAAFGEAACGATTRPAAELYFPRLCGTADCDDYLSLFHVYGRATEAATLHYAPALVQKAEQWYTVGAKSLYDEARKHGYRLDTCKPVVLPAFCFSFPTAYYNVMLSPAAVFPATPWLVSAVKIRQVKVPKKQQAAKIPLESCDDVEMTSERQCIEHQVQKQHTQQRWHHGQQMLEWHLRNPAVVDIPNCAMVTCC
eukprot:TRINITY_DN221_c0_g2_i1.p1 TRINITY_DN221_c0_g2~~TRINITY_DN221_c0_g2_i1.p1  ORF type:complete len:341 (+),score=43.41 TRINITY_DN221_c0_g2_i1:623-1645(+)